MADEEDKKAKDDAKDEKGDDSKKGGPKIGIITWIIVVVIVFICAGSGLFLGRVLGGAGSSEEPTSQAEETDVAEDAEEDDSEENSKNCWYYDLEPVVANLDEPRVTRYVRVTITLEISSNLETGEGTKLLESKKPVLNNWLTIYLAGLTLEDVRGDRSLKRIQSQILDAFNEKLFPDSKPQVKHILFKEFAIQ